MFRKKMIVSVSTLVPDHAIDEVPAPPRIGKPRRREGSAFLAVPALVWYLVFMIGPLAAMFVISLLNWPSIIAPGTWAGLGNFQRLLNDPTFWHAFGNTMLQLVIVLPLMIPLAFMAGYYLSLRPRGHRLLSVLFFTPGLISVSTKAMMFFGILSPRGALNGLLQSRDSARVHHRRRPLERHRIHRRPLLGAPIKHLW
jgi:multiple sugar transport system permease protein